MVLTFQQREEEEEDPYSTDDGSTASLSESILNYRTLHGRSYHSNRGDAEYWYVFSEISLRRRLVYNAVCVQGPA